jgi:hypothetical protein
MEKTLGLSKKALDRLALHKPERPGIEPEKITFG